MENENIGNILSDFICSEIFLQKDRKLSVHEPIISSGLIDSFHLVDLALFVEDTFGVVLDDTELNADHFDTLAELVKLVENRMS